MAIRHNVLVVTRLTCGWRIWKILLRRILKLNPILYVLRFIFNLFLYPSSLFFEVLFTFQLICFDFFLFSYSFTLYIFYLHVKVHLGLMIWVNTRLRTWMIGMNLGLLMALVEFKGRLFNYLDNWTLLSCIGDDMWKGRRDKRD